MDRSRVFVLMFLFGFLNSIQAENIHVLVLHSYYHDLPWSEGFQRGLKSAQADRFPDVDFYYEYMEETRLGNALSEAMWVEYLSAKYSRIKPDIILADSDRAANFLSAHPNLFGAVPQALYTGNPVLTTAWQLSLDPEVEASVKGTYDLAFAQNRDARNVIIIDGGTSSSVNILNLLLPLLEGKETRIIECNKTTVERIKDELGQADPHAIVFYTLIFSDSSGKNYVPKNALKELAAVSSAPIYSFWSSLMDSGAVGGYMIDAEITAEGMISACMDYLKTEEFGNSYFTVRYIIDWTAMREHGISSGTIPESSAIINKPPSVFISYYRGIITAFSSLILISLIITIILLRKNQIKNKILHRQGKELHAAISEKEILMKEMNHRIKNNLAILRSLVHLQIDEIDDEKLKGHLADIEGRLGTLALVHEQLYETVDNNDFKIKEYLEALIKQIFDSMAPEPRELELKMEIDDLAVSVKKAISYGLIVNELLTNAIKHAFPEGGGGLIFIKFGMTDTGEIELSIKDDGIGLLPDTDIRKNCGLGIRVVQALSTQIDGDFDIVNHSKGAEFIIRCKTDNE